MYYVGMILTLWFRLHNDVRLSLKTWHKTCEYFFLSIRISADYCRMRDDSYRSVYLFAETMRNLWHICFSGNSDIINVLLCLLLWFEKCAFYCNLASALRRLNGSSRTWYARPACNVYIRRHCFYLRIFIRFMLNSF